MKWTNIISMALTTLMTIGAQASSKGNGDVGSVGANSWECSQQVGLSQAETQKVRLEKQKNGQYSVYITASAGDTGPRWNLDDVQLSRNMNCKFTKTDPNALYCEVQDENGWTTVTSSSVQIQSLDQTTGADVSLKYTNVIVSSSNELMKHFNNSVFILQAPSCLLK